MPDPADLPEPAESPGSQQPPLSGAGGQPNAAIGKRGVGAVANWYIQLEEGEVGPLTEYQLRTRLVDARGVELATWQVRQGSSRWYPAIQVLNRFRDLAENGIYLRRARSTEVEGPFTLVRAIEIVRSGFQGKVRRGRNEIWQSPDEFLAWHQRRTGGQANRAPAPPVARPADDEVLVAELLDDDVEDRPVLITPGNSPTGNREVYAAILIEDDDQDDEATDDEPRGTLVSPPTTQRQHRASQVRLSSPLNERPSPAPSSNPRSLASAGAGANVVAAEESSAGESSAGWGGGGSHGHAGASHQAGSPGQPPPFESPRTPTSTRRRRSFWDKPQNAMMVALGSFSLLLASLGVGLIWSLWGSGGQGEFADNRPAGNRRAVDPAPPSSDDRQGYPAVREVPPTGRAPFESAANDPSAADDLFGPAEPAQPSNPFARDSGLPTNPFEAGLGDVPGRSPRGGGRNGFPPGSSSGPPIVPPGVLFRPVFTTTEGRVDAGSAFMARTPGSDHPILLSVLHLLGPAGGLESQLGASEVGDRWQEVRLKDCVGGAITPELAGKALSLPATAPFPELSAHGDVIAFLPEKRGSFQPYLLSLRPPLPNEEVWMVAEVIGRESLTHPARIAGQERGWMSYEFDDPELELRATSGAPIVNADGEVVAVHAGGGERGGKLVGFGTAAFRFLPVLRIEAGLR